MVKRREVYDKVKNIFWAAAFAVVLWLVMVQSQQQARTTVAEFEVVAPPGLNVAYSPENKMPRSAITVKGSPAALMQLPQSVRAIHEMPKDTKPGHYPVLFRNFNFGTLPAGIDVDTASLIGGLEVDLDKVEEKRLPIHPSLDATNLPAGWEIAHQEVDPTTWRASGPEDVMKKPGQQLTTTPVILANMLDVTSPRFDPLRLEPQELELALELRKPTDAPKMNFVNPPEHRPILLRFTLRPKQRQADIEIPPTFVLSGPKMDGFLYKFDPNIDRIKLTISGPDDDLREGQLEATKAKILAVCRLDKLIAEFREGKNPFVFNFEIEVIAPPEIKVIAVTDPKDKLYRVKIAPVEPLPRPGQ